MRNEGGLDKHTNEWVLELSRERADMNRWRKGSLPLHSRS